MSTPRAVLSMVWSTVLAGSLLVAAPFLSADDGFSSQLSPDQLVASGVARLTPSERVAVDQIVATEMSESRLAEGRVLAGTFSGRRTEAETKEAGLDKLTADELSRLNELVAASAVDHPKPRERPRLRDDNVINTKLKSEVHGSLSFTYGRIAGGHSFRGTDLWLTYGIPELGLTLGFGMSRYSGGAPLYYYPAPGDPHFLHGDPFKLETTGRGLHDQDLNYGTGESFQLANSLGALSYSQHRY
jgi:hypothetical protein